MAGRWVPRRLPPARVPLTASPAPPLRGLDPAGEDCSLTLSSGRTVVVFVTVGCRECARVWSALADLAPGRPDHADLVVVTPGPGTESARRVGALVPRAVDHVVMGDGAWLTWRAGAAPWCAVVDDGMVTAEGQLRDPNDLVGLLGR